MSDYSTSEDEYGLAWDYENLSDFKGRPSFYHIYAFDAPGETIVDGALEIAVPMTPENDADVVVIMAALRRIISRHADEEQRK
jgi:hypothetical protein